MGEGESTADEPVTKGKLLEFDDYGDDPDSASAESASSHSFLK
jgi:hypothetical protein